MSDRTESAATPLVRAFSRELARAGGLLAPDYLASGLSLGEARCLYDVGNTPGLDLSALAERLDLDLGYVSRVVSRLAARGLMTKRVAARDARARSLALTAKGQRQLAALDRQSTQRLDAWLGAKPAPAVAQLVGGLRAFFDDPGAAPAESAAGDAAPAGRVVLRDPRPGMLGHIIARHGEIYVNELGYPPVFEGYVVQAFGAFMATFAPPRDRIFVAERGGQLIGSIAVKGLPDRVSQLRFLLVEPAARGLGIGRKLVRRVLDHARAEGARRVVLDTASDLAAARALYTAHGFALESSVADEPWLPRGVNSERWVLAL